MVTLRAIMSEFEIFQKLVIFIFIWAVFTFLYLSRVSAPYGKFKRKGWGPPIPNSLGWIIFESPSVLLFAYVFFKGQYSNNLVSIVLLIFWSCFLLFYLWIKSCGRVIPRTVLVLIPKLTISCSDL